MSEFSSHRVWWLITSHGLGQMNHVGFSVNNESVPWNSWRIGEVSPSIYADWGNRKLFCQSQMYGAACFQMQKNYENSIKLILDPFTNYVSQVYGCFFPGELVTSHFINLYLTMVFQYLESTLHTLVVATSDKPQTSFQVIRNNLCCQEQPLLSGTT